MKNLNEINFEAEAKYPALPRPREPLSAEALSHFSMGRGCVFPSPHSPSESPNLLMENDLKERKPLVAEMQKDDLPIAYSMLLMAFETALTHIAENSDAEDWNSDLYDRIQQKLEKHGGSIMTATEFKRDNLPPHLQNVARSVKAGSATVDAAFDAVITAMQKRHDGDT